MKRMRSIYVILLAALTLLWLIADDVLFNPGESSDHGANWG
jgi:hypothetical protein